MLIWGTSKREDNRPASRSLMPRKAEPVLELSITCRSAGQGIPWKGDHNDTPMRREALTSCSKIILSIKNRTLSQVQSSSVHGPHKMTGLVPLINSRVRTGTLSPL